LSACPVPLPDRWSSSIRNACFTPVSYFSHALDLDSQAQLLCFSLILVETLGSMEKWKRSQPAEISYEQFTQTANVSREAVLNALDYLERADMIRISRSERGRPMYAIREEYIHEVQKAGKEAIRGRCPDCKTIGYFETRFIPVPHVAFRKLGACVDPATFKAVMVVCRYTLEWNKEGKCLDVVPRELDLNDFCKLTGLKNREITSGLSKAAKLGLIGRTQRPGKPSLFWAIPEQFGKLDRREPRTVSPPQSVTERMANSGSHKVQEIPTKPENTQATESKYYFYGRCASCGHFVDVEPVSEDELAHYDSQQAEKTTPYPARAGPKRKPVAPEGQIWSSIPEFKGFK
jgi:hypothetical protein